MKRVILSAKTPTVNTSFTSAAHPLERYFFAPETQPFSKRAHGGRNLFDFVFPTVVLNFDVFARALFL